MKYFRVPSFILLALLSAYEEVMQLIQRGSWHEGMTWLPIWNTDWDGFWKLFDAHHSVYGVFVFALAVAMRLQVKYLFKLKLNFFSDNLNYWVTEILHIAIIWQCFFWFRNIGMHILFMNPEYIRWKYLLPITF